MVEEKITSHDTILRSLTPFMNLNEESNVKNKFSNN
jgi:hypothetical protein